MHTAKSGSNRKVADIERLMMLFRAFRERDETAFYKAAESLIAEELAANHHGLARDLQDALGQPRSRRNATASVNRLSPLPKDRRSGEQLVSIQERPVDTSRLILSNRSWLLKG